MQSINPILFTLIDNFLEDPKKHKEDILSYSFFDISLNGVLFKGMQPIEDSTDEFAKKVSELFPDYNIAFNFARLSPENQYEPNYIHTDIDMGDITCLLYLNESPPINDGTTIYLEENNEPSIIIKSKFNRMFIFDSSLRHSRNLIENFGKDKDGRLVHVIFLKHK